jgi:hypothetical protein
MSQETTLTYSEQLIRQAVFQFWRRTVGTGFFVAFALLATAFAFFLWQGDRSWLVGALGSVLLFGAGVAGCIYFLHFRLALAKFRAMSSATATLCVEEGTLAMSSELGSSAVRWSAITEIWRFPSFWLLLFSKSQFVTLPLESLSPEVQAFIVAHVREAGGKVD